MPVSDVVIKGAREHNLRNIQVVLPRNQLICLTGVSGSGKSSLAFDTVYAEGQRRYVESLSSYARQFLGQMPKPEVDFISGLSPSISISQKSSGSNPRSTVGTITEIYDFLRVLYARIGEGFCPQCGRRITAQSREQILGGILALPAGTRISVLAPLVRQQKGEYRDLFEDLVKQGYARARVDGRAVRLSDALQLDRQMRHDIDLIVDRLVIKEGIRPRLAEAVEEALKLGRGTLVVTPEGSGDEDAGHAPSPGATSAPDVIYSADYACTACGLSFEPPSPQLFSFNSPQGMCPQCDGLGQLFSFDPELLVPNPQLSFQQGAIEIVGSWKEMGRWRRHVYRGVASTLEREYDLPAGTLLETSWCELDPQWCHLLLWGTGDRHITYTWRGGAAPVKYGGKYEGIVPELLSKHRTSKSRPQVRQLEKYMRSLPCPACRGERLLAQARAVRVTTAHPDWQDAPSKTLPEVCRMSVRDAARFLARLQLDATGELIAAELLKEIRNRLGFLVNVGLDYLALDRTAPTLSGGESQRIRLASQIGSGLVGVLYILDEPSIGLHPRDNQRLLDTLCRLRDMGNTVVVVEHDEETMRAADYLVDFGPGPGVRGGEVVAAGSLEDLTRTPASITGQYLAGSRRIEIPRQRRPVGSDRLRVLGAAHNNLHRIDVEIPLGTFVCVTGVSGSGKSSLVNDILVEALRRDLNGGLGEPGTHDGLDGLEHLDKMIAIDQSPIGRTPRSNPGTYIKVFDDIRQLFAQLPESKRRGYQPGRFSFNVARGRCSACDGNGSNRLEMDFLADVWVTCPVCEGHRYNHETLQVTFKGKSIAEVLEMDVQQALELFENIPQVRHKLQTLHDVGLDYLKLGQPSPTLSGGEAQRIKLARELVKRSTGRTLYLLDEPTTGLHFADIELLLKVLHGFVDAGNTVLVVEHNLDVIKTADWVIDLGPEGGDAGGRVVVAGTPEEVARCRASFTGHALAGVLAAGAAPGGVRAIPSRGRRRRPVPPSTKLSVRGAQQHNLKSVSMDIERDQMTVFCGPSGSGKSSLAMDTIYAEGQRRYVESLSAYARQFVSQMQKPRVDHIDGLSPAIAIEQKNLGHTPRSTVGTVTEVYDYLRILMARLGVPHCPECERAIGTQTTDQIAAKVMEAEEGTRALILAPVDVAVGQDYASLWSELQGGGYLRVRIDGEIYRVDKPPAIDRRRKHRVEVIVDRVAIHRTSRARIAEAVEVASALGKGEVRVAYEQSGVLAAQWPTTHHSQHLACEKCGRSFDPLTPHNFSFNSPLGWCHACEGLGTQVGANPAVLLRDAKLTLRAGAVTLWPDVHHDVSQWMLQALSDGTGIPLDLPYDQLSARQRRLVMHGCGDSWFDVYPAGMSATRPLFRFQFKGLYPALEEAARLSPSLRARLEHLIDQVECSVCSGSRVRDDAAAVRFQGRTIDELCRLPLGQLREVIAGWKLSVRERRIAGELIREVTNRTQFLTDVGLHYLTLARGAATLSNGEAQRIRLASQLGSGLCGVLYVLDEPTIGLHPRDNARLLAALHKLRDLGNTLIVVEHDRDVIAGSDRICDFGPAAGKLGGEIVAQGTPRQVARCTSSVTGPYLRGTRAVPIPAQRRMQPEVAPSASTRTARGRRRSVRPAAPTPPAWEAPGGQWLEIRGAKHHNLQNVHVRIPLSTLTVVSGPSGSGKSSLIADVLYPVLARRLHRASLIPGAHDDICGIEFINKVIQVDQQALGNSPTSNPATYTGVFELIRALFAQLPDAKMRGYSPRRFSFNVPGGRCERCEGNGQLRIEMHFLPDVWVECDTCRGRRYNPETLAVTYHGRSISDVLDMTCGEAVRLFDNIPRIRRILQTLCDVGLDYLTLGQAAPTLSGGEAQRVKLAAELARPDTGRTLYLLDEPTTGLHFEDLSKLLEVLHRLVDLGNSVVLIEHNLDVIKSADWVIDMGPEAGDEGGYVVAVGTPEDLVAHARSYHDRDGNGQAEGPRRSYTGEALAPVLAAGPYVPRTPFDPVSVLEERPGDRDIMDVGREAKMPWEVDGRRWHVQDRVGRAGEPCRWDGRILEAIVDRIQTRGSFSAPDWNSRSVVEIAGEKKSLGWFFHALTGETWLLKLKFRVAKNTFQRTDLIERLGLKTLNQLDEIPKYGNEPRVKCQSLRGPWQEVQVNVHSWEEVDTPAFWSFIEEAMAGFESFTRLTELNLEDHAPWKKLGQRWHFMRKGFSPGKRIQWELAVWEELYEILQQCAPDGQFLWNNQVLVHLILNGQREPWITINTKRCESLDMTLSGPKGCVTLGRIAGLAREQELDGTRDDRELVRLRFRTVEDLHRGDLIQLLHEHRDAVLARAR